MIRSDFVTADYFNRSISCGGAATNEGDGGVGVFDRCAVIGRSHRVLRRRSLRQLAELNEYINSSDTNDAWGRPLKMLCGAALPAGAKGIGVLSVGEDGKEGTDDDIKSWALNGH